MPQTNAMKQADKATHWLDQPRHIQRLWRGFLVVLALTIVAQFFVHPHPHFDVESIFGFSAWFGFMACAATVAVAKALALLLKRPETYYGQRDD